MSRAQDLDPWNRHLSRPAPPMRRAALIAFTVLVLVLVAGYALTVVATYLENGLNAVPLSEVGGGAYDPSTLPFPPSETAGLLGGLFLLLVPVASGLGAVAVGLDLVIDDPSRPRSERMLGLAVFLLCVVIFLGYLAVAQLSVWWLD